MITHRLFRLLRPRPRVGVLVDPKHLFRIQIGIELGAGQGGMAEEILNGAQVADRARLLSVLLNFPSRD